MPVTMPKGETVAWLVLEQLHEPPVTALLNVVPALLQNVVTPVIGAVGVTVTALVVLQFAYVVNVIVTAPPDAPVTVPPPGLTEITVARLVLLQLHVPPPEVPSTSDNACPWHTLLGAGEIGTNGLIVKGAVLIHPVDEVNLMDTLEPPAAVTTPVLYTTVATPLLELLHVPLPPPEMPLLKVTD